MTTNKNANFFFSKNLNILMEFRGIQKKDLCRKTGILNQNLKQYLSGEKYPNLRTIERIAKALDVSVSDILSANPYTQEKFSIEKVSNSIAQSLKKTLVFENLSLEETLRLYKAVDAFGGWKVLLSTLEQNLYEETKETILTRLKTKRKSKKGRRINAV